MRKFIADLPPARSQKVLREVATRDQEYQGLKGAVKQGRKLTDRDKVPYRAVRKEPGVQEEPLGREERNVIPEPGPRRSCSAGRRGTSPRSRGSRRSCTAGGRGAPSWGGSTRRTACTRRATPTR